MASTNADNLAVEPPIYIENVSRTREHTYRASAADGLHRQPVYPTEEIWNQYQQIPLTPNPALVPNGGPIGIVPVELIQMQLRPVAGSTLKWEQDAVQPLPLPPPLPGAPGDLVRVIPATFGNKDLVPGAYQPTLLGGPAYDGHTWVVDGVNRYVEFPYGSPTGPTTLTLQFYRYTGLTGGGTAGLAGQHVWRYVADATAPNLTLCPDPAYPGAAQSHFVAPLTAFSTEGAGSRIMFDVTKSAVRAGLVTGTQWDDVNRGAESVAFGQDTVAAGAQSVVSGGLLNTVDAASNQSGVGGGQSNAITASALAFISGGILNLINNGNFSYIGGGSTNHINAGQRNVIVCGDYNTITTPNGAGNLIGAGTTNLIDEVGGNVGAQSFIGAGNNNHVQDVFGGAIVSGQRNTLTVGASFSSIVGGRQNTIAVLDSFIGGGVSNGIPAVQGNYTGAICGGEENLVNGSHGFIGGGYQNRVGVNTFAGVVCGGSQNSASGVGGNTFVGGGVLNRAITGNAAIVGGGAPNGAIAGAVGNTASGYGSFIGGGGYTTGIGATDAGHVASGNYSLVVGGGFLTDGKGNPIVGHQATGAYSAIVGGGGDDSGGDHHEAFAPGSFIGGGAGHRIAVAAIRSATVGGFQNQLGSQYGFVGGGNVNTIGTGADYGTIGGGDTNSVQNGAAYGTVAGGSGNQVIGQYGVVCGGQSGGANGNWSFIGGGFACAVSPTGNNSSIVGGQNNFIQTGAFGLDHSFIGGGGFNSVEAAYSSIVGGGATSALDIPLGRNQITGSPFAFIGGGRGNRVTATTATAIACFIGGGLANVINEADGAVNRYYNLIVGGRNNTVTNSSVCAIVGGGGNTVNVPRGPGGPGSDRGYAFIGAGQNNQIIQSSWSAVVAGENNRIESFANLAEGYNFIGAGENHRIYSPAGSAGTTNGIVSGTSNQIGSAAPADPGATNCFIGAGQTNVISAGLNSTIVCGTLNTISGAGSNQAVIGGGQGNTVNPGANNSVIPGGLNNVVSAAQAFAAGTTASALHTGAFVWSDSTGTTASTGVDQFVAGCNGGVTFWSNTARTLGVNLAPAATAWAAVCDQNMKENVLVLNPTDVLRRVDELPVYEFNYKGADAETRFRGPMAQDWHRLFPSKKDPLRIDTLDLDGIALAAIKGLSELVKQQSERIAALEAKLGAK